MARELESVATRLAVLEERTTPKPKTLLDKLKDWGGLITLVIAVFYTFPTTYVQQWIDPGKKEQEELRGIIEQSTMVLAEGIKAVASTNDQIAKQQLNRYYHTRAYLIMAHHEEKLFQFADKLTPPELMVAGLNFNTVDRSDLSHKLFDVALKKLEASIDPKTGRMQEMVTYFQIMRGKAQADFAPGALQNIKRGRAVFEKATGMSKTAQSVQEKLGLIDVLNTWAGMERLHGDWRCSQEKLNSARELHQTIADQLFDNGLFFQQLAFTAQIPQKPNQPEIGCI
jgi:hypothetical protein